MARQRSAPEEPATAAHASAEVGRMAGPLLALAVAAFAPLLGSLALRPLCTGLLAGWTVLLGLGLALEASVLPPGRLASSLVVLVLLAGFAGAHSVLRTAALRRLGQARAVARVAQSALLREVPASGAAARPALPSPSASRP